MQLAHVFTTRANSRASIAGRTKAAGAKNSGLNDEPRTTATDARVRRLHAMVSPNLLNRYGDDCEFQ